MERADRALHGPMEDHLATVRSGSGGSTSPMNAVVHRKREGFALVTVVWSLGLVALLATIIVVGARYRSKAVVHEASAATASAAAESAVHLAIGSLLPDPSGRMADFPLRCQMPTGERVAIFVEAETGKVDLNTASPAVLTLLFTSLTQDPRLGAQIAANILSKRKPISSTPGATAGKDKGRSTAAGYSTIMELDQIEGVSTQLFRKATPLVTVWSGKPEPDPETSSESLVSLLHLDSSRAKKGTKTATGGSLTIRAEVGAPDGAKSVREALVSFMSENNRPFVVREWRRPDFGSQPLRKVLFRSQGGSCFSFVTNRQRPANS